MSLRRGESGIMTLIGWSWSSSPLDESSVAGHHPNSAFDKAKTHDVALARNFGAMQQGAATGSRAWSRNRRSVMASRSIVRSSASAARFDRRLSAVGQCQRWHRRSPGSSRGRRKARRLSIEKAGSRSAPITPLWFRLIHKLPQPLALRSRGVMAWALVHTLDWGNQFHERTVRSLTDVKWNNFFDRKCGNLFTPCKR